MSSACFRLKMRQDRFERMGVLPFQTEKPQGPEGGRPQEYVLLNENQAYFLLTLSRFFQKSEGFRLKREPFNPPSAGFFMSHLCKSASGL